MTGKWIEMQTKSVEISLTVFQNIRKGRKGSLDNQLVKSLISERGGWQ